MLEKIIRNLSIHTYEDDNNRNNKNKITIEIVYKN